MNNSRRYDYIIVGGGTAGCVVAARLSEDPNTRVCLIEAGGSDRSPAIRIPFLAFIANSSAKWSWGYKTEPVEGFEGRSVGLTQGKLLGGSSSINGMLYGRSYSGEYDQWDIPGWDFASLLPYFKRSETYCGEPSEWRGSSGPLPVRRAETRLPIGNAFLSAARAAGHPIVDDLNGDVAHGFGYLDYTVKAGQRESSYSAFIRSLRERPNLVIRSSSQVLRIRLDRGRATAVDIAHGRVIKTLLAEREIILSAGAINSPKLLMLSGIGPADILHRNGVQVVLDRPSVGKNLVNHVRYNLLYETNKPVTALRYMMPPAAIAGGLNYLFRRKGFLSTTPLPIGGVISTDPDTTTPDVNIVLSTALMGAGPGALRMLPKRHGFAILVRQGAPRSRGEVQLRSAEPSAAPIINAGYLSDPRDLECLKRGIHAAREIARQADLAHLISREIQPGAAAEDDAALTAEIRAKANNVFHAVGTCRLGTDDGSVVDPQLRVRGIEGLRIADTSVLPSLVNAGTYALALMTGERAAAFITGN